MNIEQFLLLKLAEEASEVAKDALKAAQFGLDEEGAPYDNRARLNGELNDLLAIVSLLNSNTTLNYLPDQDHAARKCHKVKEYLGYSIRLGKVEDMELKIVY